MKKLFIAKVVKQLWIYTLYDEFGTWIVQEGGTTASKWLVPGTGA